MFNFGLVGKLKPTHTEIAAKAIDRPRDPWGTRTINSTVRATTDGLVGAILNCTQNFNGAT
jgi:hypothetical protein